jgi:hypothetical protein
MLLAQHDDDDDVQGKEMNLKWANKAGSSRGAMPNGTRAGVQEDVGGCLEERRTSIPSAPETLGCPSGPSTTSGTTLEDGQTRGWFVLTPIDEGLPDRDIQTLPKVLWKNRGKELDGCKCGPQLTQRDAAEQEGKPSKQRAQSHQVLQEAPRPVCETAFLHLHYYQKTEHPETRSVPINGLVRRLSAWPCFKNQGEIHPADYEVMTRFAYNVRVPVK